MPQSPSWLRAAYATEGRFADPASKYKLAALLATLLVDSFGGLHFW